MPKRGAQKKKLASAKGREKRPVNLTGLKPEEESSAGVSGGEEEKHSVNGRLAWRSYGTRHQNGGTGKGHEAGRWSEREKARKPEAGGEDQLPLRPAAVQGGR